MESGALESSAAPGPVRQPVNMACLRRQAWAKSRDSTWQESKPDPQSSQDSQLSPSSSDALRATEEPGPVPNEITNWLIECRTPLGASLDDQSPSPSKGAPRNGCSFEDDLSLGAEANHMQSENSKPESCLAANQKRNQYKEKGRSMNSTGSGKSSTVSRGSELLEQSEEQPVEIHINLRVSELLDLYEEDPEEILMNLGFGREEPDLNSKIPARFFNGSSSARGIDIKVYLRAQLQRVELENPSYALTIDLRYSLALAMPTTVPAPRESAFSANMADADEAPLDKPPPLKAAVCRFRQIEVLTTVANEFFQLYSQVSGQPVQRISSKDKDETGEGGRTDEQPPSLKKTNSARNVAKILKRTISKHNLLAASSSSSSPESHEASAQLNANAKTASEATPVTNEQGGCSTSTDHKADTVSQKLIRKKDNCSLATVTEESSGDGETESKSHNSPDKGSTVPDQLQSAELLSAEQEVQELQVEQNQTSTPEKLPATLAPPKLVQLRTENANSFDMEEIQSNEDENLPPRMSRATDLLRTVSQQSDSSGFAEDPSADSSSYLKVQESSDSCDSETTVTSHPSQDLTTPVALKHLTFDLPEVTQEEAGLKDTTEADGRSSSLEEQELNGNSEMIPQYAAHQLPKLTPLDVHRGESQSQDLDPEPQTTDIVLAAEQEPQLDLEDTQSQAISGQDPENTPTLTETPTDTNLLTETDSAEDTFQEESLFFDPSGLLSPPVPSFQVLNALNRAKEYKVRGAAQGLDPQETPPSSEQERGRRGMMRLRRSSSLPSSFLSPSTIVSSVKIHVGQGQMSCSQPRYSVKYSKDKEGEEQELQEEEQTNVLSTLIINPSSSGATKMPPNTIPPKAIPRHLHRSTCSLQSSSPPPVWSPGEHPDSWSTQSVPNFFSSQQSLGQFSHLKMNQNQQSWSPAQTMFPHQNPSSQYLEQSSCPSSNSSQYSSSMFPYPHYPSPLHPFASLPNLVPHHSSLPGLQHPATPPVHPATPPVHPHHSMSNLHHPSTAPRHVNLSFIHPGTPTMHHQGYSHPYPHQASYHAAPHGQQFASPHVAYQGYSNTLLAIPNPVLHYPPMHSDHTPYQNPLNTGFIPGQDSMFDPSHSLYLGPTPPAGPGPGSSQASSSTEMQLRRVLHEIRGTVQSLSEIQADTPDTFTQHRTASSSRQILAEFQQKRRNLNLFRRQMMDLELSIIQQQALVYHQLGPADRVEVEKLQALRCNVRDELAELEQQLEERLMELIDDTKHRGLHSNSSVDDLTTISALRAMEPVSDLLGEQLFLRSELGYDDRDQSADISTCSSSPVRAAVGGGEQKHKLFRTSVDITPAPPPRPNAHTQSGKGGDGEEKGGEDSGAAAEGRGTNGEDVEEDGASTRLRVDDLQLLIQEIRDSVAQEIRQEIYSELRAAITPLQPSSSTRQRPL